MPINREKYERSFIRTRNRIEKKGQKLAFNAIKKQYKAVYDLVGIYSVDQLKESIDKVVNTAPIVELFTKFYPMFAPLAVMERNNAVKQKAEEDLMWENLFMDKLRAIGLLKAGEKITSITATTEKFIRGAVESAITEAVENGYGIDETSRLIRKYLTDSLGDIGRSRAKMIAQTEMISASNQAATFGIESTGYAYKKYWSTSGLENTRDSHLNAERDSIERGGLKPDERFSNGLLYPGDPNGAPEEVINCYTGDMNIKSAIVGAQKLFYSGDMVKIITRGGKWLTVTPNHHVLTENGFIRACDINKGDNLLCDSKDVETFRGVFRNSNNVDNKKPVISEVFSSIVAKFGSKFTPVVGLDFDGDGKNGKGDVNIVNTNRKLLFNRKLRFQNIGNFIFKQTDSQRRLIHRFCSLNLGFNGMVRTSNGIMRFFNLVLSLLGGHFTPFKFLGLGLSSEHYALFNKMPGKRDSWYPALIRKLVKTNPTIIHLDEVVDVVNFNFSGHVYDFTSLTGTNIINNIYTSNCRCTVLHEII